MEIPHSLHQRIPSLPGVSENQEAVATFQRYWQHYEMMQEWMRKYVKAWNDNRNSYSRKMTHKQRGNKKITVKTGTQKFAGHRRACYHSNSSDQGFSPPTEEHVPAERVHGNQDASSSGSEFEVEVSEEFKQFFIQSQKHRDEREKRKQDEVKEREQAGVEGSKHNIEAPKERPGSKRNEEMKVSKKL